MSRKLRAYKVKPDFNKFQYFLWEMELVGMTAAMYDALSCDGRRKGDHWKPPPVSIYNPRHKRGDFFAVGIGGGGLVMAPWAMAKVHALQMFAELAGELLPLEYKNQVFTLLNITVCLDCLDEERSKWLTHEDGKRTMLKPFLRVDRTCPSNLFKSTHSPFDIFCLEYSHNPNEEFKACVEYHKLTGLLFEEVAIG